MTRLVKSICLVFLSLFFFSAFVFADDVTITTYYPSPSGSYNYLQADKLGVGDNNKDGSFTSADVPTNSGDVWIKGKVGIGTTNPSTKFTVVADDPVIGSVGIGGLQGNLWFDGGTDGIASIQMRAPGGRISFTDSHTPAKELLSVMENGKVGIGTADPKTQLDVDGGIKPGQVADSDCSSSSAGTIRWSSSDKVLQFCDGSVWQGISTEGLSATCIAGDSWTDVYSGCSCGSGTYCWEGTQTCHCVEETTGETWWDCIYHCPPPPMPCPS